MSIDPTAKKTFSLNTTTAVDSSMVHQLADSVQSKTPVIGSFRRSSFSLQPRPVSAIRSISFQSSLKGEPLGNILESIAQKITDILRDSSPLHGRELQQNIVKIASLRESFQGFLPVACCASSDRSGVNPIESLYPEKRVVLDFTSRDVKELRGQYVTRTDLTVPYDHASFYLRKLDFLEKEIEPERSSKFHFHPVTLQEHPAGFFFNRCSELPFHKQKKCESAVKILESSLPQFSTPSSSLSNNNPLQALRQEVSKDERSERQQKAHAAIDTLQKLLGTIKIERRGIPPYEETSFKARRNEYLLYGRVNSMSFPSHWLRVSTTLYEFPDRKVLEASIVSKLSTIPEFQAEASAIASTAADWFGGEVRGDTFSAASVIISGRSYEEMKQLSHVIEESAIRSAIHEIPVPPGPPNGCENYSF